MEPHGSINPMPAPAEPEPAQPIFTEPPVQRHVQGRKKHAKLIMLLVIIAILIIGGGVTFALFGQHKPTQKQQSTQSSSQQQQSQVTPDTSTTSTTQQYVSNGKDLNLSFSYPSNWSASPASNNNANDQPITLSSPLISISDTTGNTRTGRIIVSVRPGGADLTELASGSATAAQTSTQFAYAKPTPVQHQYPYLTFIHLTGGANANGSFEEVMITGIKSFTKTQTISTYSLSQLDPIISASMYACKTQACASSADMTPLSITLDTWQNNISLQQVQAIFASLQLN